MVVNKKRWRGDGRTCVDCGKGVCDTSARCSVCAGLHAAAYKAAWPSPEELLEEVARTNKCAVARRLGVSATAVRLHMRRHPARSKPAYSTKTNSYGVVDES